MHSRYIQSFTAFFLDPDNEQETLPPFAASLPKRATRRMSRLGILLCSALDGLPIDSDTTLVYGTTYTEANALESFLSSLPFASPTAFQTSIHPGGVEQALIMNKQAVGPFLPMAGKQYLVPQLLKAPFTATTGTTLLCGGEEKGGWLRDFGVAHPESFAFSMRVSGEEKGALGLLEWDPAGGMDAPAVPLLVEAIRSLHESGRLALNHPDHGSFKIDLS